MRLLRLSAHFGVLDGETFCFEPGRLNLIIDGNERGKSTFVAAVVAALYGLTGHGPASEQQRYQPLDGRRFDVELDLLAGGRRLRIRRDFGRGTCSVNDLDTVEDVTGQFQSGKSRWDIGRPLLGLSREQFLRSAMVRQGEIGGLGLGKEAATLTSRIQQLVDTSTGDHTADAAIAALDEALRQYEGETFATRGNVQTEIRTLEERIGKAEQRLLVLRRGRAELDADAERMLRLRRQAVELRQRRDRAAACADHAEAQRAAQRLQQDDRRRSRWDELGTEHAALADLPATDPRLADQLAALDGAITTLDRRIADEHAALRVAENQGSVLGDRLAERQQFTGTTPETAQAVIRACERLRAALDGEATASKAFYAATSNGQEADPLAERFDRLSPMDVEDLSRYGERRSELLSAALPQPGAAPAGGTSRIALIGGIGCVVAGVALLLVLPVTGILLALAGAGLTAWALLHHLSSAAGETSAHSNSTAQQLRLLDERTGAIARSLGYDGIAPALDGLRDWQDARGRREQIRAVLRQHTDAAAALTEARRVGATLLVRWGRSVAEGDIDPGLLLALHAELNAYLHDGEALAQAQELEAAIGHRLENLCRERATAIDSFARAAGAAASSIEQRTAARTRTVELLAALARRAALAVQIAEIEAGLLTTSERARLQHLAAQIPVSAPQQPQPISTERRIEVARLASLLRAVAGATATPGATASKESSCGGAVNQPPVGRTNDADDRGEAAWLGAEAERCEAEAGELRAALAVALNDFEREYPLVEAAVAEDRRALVRASGFAGSAGLAREVLAGVARETHRDWSRRLNEATSAILARFATDHTEMRFSEQLEFVVRDRNSGHEWTRLDVDRRLSAGARDQLYLAIRFALAGYFSRVDDPLPLILDDPLVTSDDTRFAAVMAYLAEQARTRQVIVLTCHAERHRPWAESK